MNVVSFIALKTQSPCHGQQDASDTAFSLPTPHSHLPHLPAAFSPPQVPDQAVSLPVPWCPWPGFPLPLRPVLSLRPALATSSPGPAPCCHHLSLTCVPHGPQSSVPAPVSPQTGRFLSSPDMAILIFHRQTKQLYLNLKSSSSLKGSSMSIPVTMNLSLPGPETWESAREVPSSFPGPRPPSRQLQNPVCSLY